MANNKFLEETGLSRFWSHVKKLVDEKVGEKAFYPVGAIYMSVSPTSPASLFGGTWERIKGYTPAGINEEDEDTNVKTSFNQSAGKTIGSKWLQRHTHQQYVTSNDGGQAIRKDYVSDGNSQIYPQCQTGNTGDGDAQNIQPTILVYMWKRVS